MKPFIIAQKAYSSRTRVDTDFLSFRQKPRKALGDSETANQGAPFNHAHDIRGKKTGFYRPIPVGGAKRAVADSGEGGDLGMSKCRSRGKVKSDSLEQPEDVAFYIRLRPHLIPCMLGVNTLY